MSTTNLVTRNQLVAEAYASGMKSLVGYGAYGDTRRERLLYSKALKLTLTR